ncbi:MAG: spermidine synthase [Thermosediminibacterales bacterium]|nr:spermidine synthase [Thermosediminibacterales bacterium]
MNTWFFEDQTKNLKIGVKINNILYSEKTKYQKLAVVDTLEFGRMLVLDDIIQTTVADEFVYHEMITHVPIFTHSSPEKVLVVGGGDGGAIREILKHPSISKAVLVEIDEGVVKASQKYLPEISEGLNDPRAQVVIEDGIRYIKEHKNEFDIIIIDSTDPIGPAVGLFALEFYKNVFNCLKDDGLFVAQTESPFFNKDLIKKVFTDINSLFSITRLYLANVPTYPGGLWTFTMGSKKYDPLNKDIKDIDKVTGLNTKYFNADIFKTCFVLPEFVRELIR